MAKKKSNKADKINLVTAIINLIAVIIAIINMLLSEGR